MRVAATQAFSFFGTVANLCRNVLSHLPSIIGLGFMSMRCGSGIATSLGSACFPAALLAGIALGARPIRPSSNGGGLRPAARADSARDERRVIPLGQFDDNTSLATGARIALARTLQGCRGSRGGDEPSLNRADRRAGSRPGRHHGAWC